MLRYQSRIWGNRGTQPWSPPQSISHSVRSAVSRGPLPQGTQVILRSPAPGPPIQKVLRVSPSTSGRGPPDRGRSPLGISRAPHPADPLLGSAPRGHDPLKGSWYNGVPNLRNMVHSSTVAAVVSWGIGSRAFV